MLEYALSPTLKTSTCEIQRGTLLGPRVCSENPTGCILSSKILHIQNTPGFFSRDKLSRGGWELRGRHKVGFIQYSMKESGQSQQDVGPQDVGGCGRAEAEGKSVKGPQTTPVAVPSPPPAPNQSEYNENVLENLEDGANRNTNPFHSHSHTTIEAGARLLVVQSGGLLLRGTVGTGADPGAVLEDLPRRGLRGQVVGAWLRISRAAHR